MSTSLNLLPAEIRQHAVRRAAIRRWLAVAVLVLLISICGAAYRTAEYNRMAKLEAAGRESADTIRALIARLSEVDGRVSTLKAELQQLQHLQPTPDPLRWIRSIDQAAAECENQLIVSSLQVNNAKDGSTAENKAGDNKTLGKEEQMAAASEWCRTTVELIGRASNDLMSARFINGLRESGAFDSVRLISTKPTSNDKRFHREFVVECVRREVAS